MREIWFLAGKSKCLGPLQAFELIRVPVLGLDGLVEHSDRQRHFIATSFGSEFEEDIVAFRLEVAIGVGERFFSVIIRSLCAWLGLFFPDQERG